MSSSFRNGKALFFPWATWRLYEPSILNNVVVTIIAIYAKLDYEKKM